MVPCTLAGGAVGGGVASGVSCQGWQPDVLNALSVGSIWTTCGFFDMELSMMAPSGLAVRFQ
jgi:hypothetical protein